MKKISLLMLLLSLTACYRVTTQSYLLKPVMFNGPQVLEGVKYRVKKQFYREAQLEYIFGTNAREQLEIGRLIREESSPNGGVINLKIQRTYRFVDVMVALFTLGIFTRSVVIVEGDVIIWE